jgi:hypothetical protein
LPLLRFMGKRGVCANWSDPIRYLPGFGAAQRL